MALATVADCAPKQTQSWPMLTGNWGCDEVMTDRAQTPHSWVSNDLWPISVFKHLYICMYVCVAKTTIQRPVHGAR